MLAKKYKPNQEEEKWRQMWKETGLYTYDPDHPGDLYAIDTPPPTVSGSLHIGHIFSYTQAEMIARYKRSRGYKVFYPFGFDDNGLPTERLVENQRKIRAKDLPRSVFRAACEETATSYEKEFTNLWGQLGFSCDWDLAYQTIAPKTQRISQRALIDLIDQGRAYREESPVLYCTHCETSIAQAELESKEADTTFNTLIFTLEGGDDQKIEIATTRPELLHSCKAIFIHPDDPRFGHLAGQKARVPLYDFTVPIMTDDQVDMDKGTGAVMCCTFGDTMDLEWFKTHGFTYTKTIDADGMIAQNVAFIGGQHVKKARKTMIGLLQDAGLLTTSQAITHALSVHERCGQEIEILPSKQWYIDLLSEKDKLLALADEINWYPSQMKNRYTTWVDNLKWNWCISRQRYFGVPFPLWYCQDCGAIKIAEDHELPINPLERNPSSPCSCGSTQFTPESAILDTWATSSITPLINSHWGEEDDCTEDLLPMAIRTQAHEIIRTWAFYTIARTYFHLGKLPWKDIMICGFVLARKGEKISKSKKNAKEEPSQLVAIHSADSLRYWAASAKLGTDTTFAEEDLKISKRFLTKLWNAAKFSIMHLTDFDPSAPRPDLLPQDQWLLARLEETKAQVAKHMDQYEVGLGRTALDEFFWKDYCDHHLELVKDRLYKPDLHGHAQRLSGQYALYHGLLDLLKLYGPFIPFITETLYQAFYRPYVGQDSIHRLTWDTGGKSDQGLGDFGLALKRILSQARRMKTENALSLKDPLSAMAIQAPAQWLPRLEAARSDLAAATHCQAIHLEEGPSFHVDLTL